MDSSAVGSPLLLAIGLVLIIEGLLPLLSPHGWRDAVKRIASLRDGQIRFIGLASIAVGLLIAVVAS